MFDIIKKNAGSFTIAKRVSVLFAFFMVFVTGLLVLLVSAKDEPINFGKQELKGNQYQRVVQDLFKNVAWYRIAASSAATWDEAQDKLKSFSEKIDQSFVALKEVDAKIGADLQYTPEGLKSRKRENASVESLENQWNAIKAMKDVKDLDSKLAELVANIRVSITQLGDTSNLILDPDLDSYYLMDVTLLALPQVQDRVQDSYIKLSTIFQKASLSEQDRIYLNTLQSLMTEADIGRISGDLQTVRNEDPNFFGPLDSIEKELAPSLNGFVEKYKSYASLIKQASEGNEMTKEAKSQILQTGREILEESFQQSVVSIKNLDSFLQNRIEVLGRSKTTSIFISILGILLSMVLGVVINRWISKDLKNVIGTLVGEVNNIEKVTEEIKTASLTLADSATKQAAAIEETVASMEEITSMISQTTNNAAECLVVSNEGSSETQNSKSIVASLNQGMGEIDNSNQKLSEITEVIDQIKNKTKVINDIVFETRLLAFNASIEAARAGIHGKGFAVVAEEVGKLANMSGRSAEEIRTLLDQSIASVNTRVEENKNKVTKGKMIAEKVDESFGKLAELLTKMSSSVSSIASATKEQQIGVTQSNMAMQEMDKITQSNSRDAENLAKLSTVLERGSHQLSSSLVDIKKLVKIDSTYLTHPVVNTIRKDFDNSGATVVEKKPLEVKAAPKVQPTDAENGMKRSSNKWKSAA